MLIDTYLISVLCPQLLTFLPANIVYNTFKNENRKKQNLTHNRKHSKTENRAHDAVALQRQQL